MNRGDVVTVALSGDYGEPRPVLVIQSNVFDADPSVPILPITREVHGAPLFRVSLAPSATNGLRKQSQVMVDKAQTVPRRKIGRTVGRMDDALLSIERELAVFLGFS